MDNLVQEAIDVASTDARKSFMWWKVFIVPAVLLTFFQGLNVFSKQTHTKTGKKPMTDMPRWARVVDFIVWVGGTIGGVYVLRKRCENPDRNHLVDMGIAFGLFLGMVLISVGLYKWTIKSKSKKISNKSVY